MKIFLKQRRFIRWVFGLALLAFLTMVGPPLIFLSAIWWHDPTAPLPTAAAGTNDASGLNSRAPSEIIALASNPADAEKQIVELVQRAARENRKIVISGARHSMGGHVLYPGGLVLDMLPFHQLALDASGKMLHAGSGARWSEIIPFLDQHGLAVAVMQSNDDFSLGGSLSVNCHGWQWGSPPLASTVESFRLVTAQGNILRCNRTENPELFSLVLGGYGLFGVILDVDLRVVPNEYYQAENHPVTPADFAQQYQKLTQGRTDLGLAYGRISVAPASFLQEAAIILLKRTGDNLPVVNTLVARPSSELNRVIFRGSVGSDYGKNLRWWLEKWLGETGGAVLSRNEIMDEPADLYANRDPAATEVLHEYFIPKANLAEFLTKARPVFLQHKPDLLNITVREVQTDPDTFLRYAREPVFGLVMLFHQPRTPAADNAMRTLTQDLINVALDCGGTYYLPYRAHATEAQFLRGYPQAKAFFEAKLHYDPAGLFENEFYQNYGEPLQSSQTTHP